MKPQKQLYRHKPEEGQWGDCFRTVIACILDMKPEEVPHFMQGRDDGYVQARLWLQDRGYDMISIGFPCELDQIMEIMEIMNPGAHWLLTGISKNGCGHIVICSGGSILWDTAQDNSGIAGPCKGEIKYYADFITIRSRAVDARVKSSKNIFRRIFPWLR